MRKGFNKMVHLSEALTEPFLHLMWSVKLITAGLWWAFMLKVNVFMHVHGVSMSQRVLCCTKNDQKMVTKQ